MLFYFSTGSGAVDFEEFCVLMQKKISQEAQSEILELFSVWDLSGEGLIESGELKCLLNRIPERLTRREIDLLVDHADTKKNGKINFEGVCLFFCDGINNHFTNLCHHILDFITLRMILSTVN